MAVIIKFSTYIFVGGTLWCFLFVTADPCSCVLSELKTNVKMKSGRFWLEWFVTVSKITKTCQKRKKCTSESHISSTIGLFDQVSWPNVCVCVCVKQIAAVLVTGLLFGGLCFDRPKRGKTMEWPCCIVMCSCSCLLRSTNIACFHQVLTSASFSPCHSLFSLLKLIRSSVSTYLIMLCVTVVLLGECVFVCVRVFQCEVHAFILCVFLNGL